MKRREQCYLLHFDEPIGNLGSPYGYAQHYTGTTPNLLGRLAAHLTDSDVKIMQAVRRAGIGWQLARVWDGGRERERQLKRQGGAARHCPVCKGQEPDVASAFAIAPALAGAARTARAAAERVEEPLWESVAAYLTGPEAAGFLGELKAAERTAWQQAAREAGQRRSAALEMACDLSRLRSAEASAAARVAEARAIAEREGWTAAELEPEPMNDQRSAGRSQPAPITPQQEGPEMGNFTDERETAESARDTGAQEARDAAAAAIGSGRYDPERLEDWAWGAAEGLHGAAVSDADRAFADGFERAALQASAGYAEADQPARSRECGAYSRARAPEAAAAEAEPAELEREAC